MKISVVCPVKNEAPWIGYSIMAIKDYIHEMIYTVAPSSNDGTVELLRDLAKEIPNLHPIISEKYDFNPHDMAAYNASFNDAIALSTGEAVWFLHPDMVVLNAEVIPQIKTGPLAWYTHMTSFAGDFNTVITKGRCDKWKNIHAKKFGVHYYGGYGSQNEDFYHKDITGKAYHHYGDEFTKYPYTVGDSGLKVNHYCELKPYARRLEKMKLCLRTQAPTADEGWIEEKAVHHPRVTLEAGASRFGQFEFKKTDIALPEVIAKYKDRFESYTKEKSWPVKSPSIA